MAANVKNILNHVKEHVLPPIPDEYYSRIIEDLWNICATTEPISGNVRLLNGLRYLTKFEPHNFVFLLEGRLDPYHVPHIGAKSFAIFEKGREKMMPRIDSYFQNEDYLKEKS